MGLISLIEKRKEIKPFIDKIRSTLFFFHSLFSYCLSFLLLFFSELITYLAVVFGIVCLGITVL